MLREHVISMDPSKPLGEEPGTGHNRWHEAIKPLVEVDPGDTVVYETRDAFDGQLNGQSTAEDVGNLDLGLVHPLTGPERSRGICSKLSWSRLKPIRGSSGVTR
jgi:formamidase